MSFLKTFTAFLLGIFVVSLFSGVAFADEPVIATLDPIEVTPGETLLTISGAGFGAEYVEGMNQLCFGVEICLSGAEVSTLVQSWSDTEIQVVVPDEVVIDSYVSVSAFSAVEDAYVEVQSADQILIAEVVAPVVEDASISSFTPELLVEDVSLIEIVGSGFGDEYVPGSSQICFETQCLSDEEAALLLNSWTDTSVAIVAPSSFDTPGNIRLKVYSAASETYEFIESGDEYSLVPKITDVSPLIVVPGVTILTITGYEFGAAYVPAGNQICFGEDCIADEFVETYLQSWSDTEIVLVVPDFVLVDGEVGLVLKVPTTEEYYYFYFETPLSVEAPAEPVVPVEVLVDPVLTYVSPLTLIPGDTVVTITGSGFGDSYVPSYSQICFGDYCITDEGINTYLQSWSDSEIVLTTPPFPFVSGDSLSLRVYFPSTELYDYLTSDALTVKQKPVIEWYYAQVDQGETYTVSGSGFGSTVGKVVLNGQEVDILSWGDALVEFTVPTNASSGQFYVESSDGYKSQMLSVVVFEVTKYSNDEFSKFQWHLGVTNMKAAWGVTTGSSDVVVAVIDSGVDITHEELSSAIWVNSDEIKNNGKDDDNNGFIDDYNGWDFYLGSNSVIPRGSHGTMVASMIAAKKDNGIGIAGIAPGVKIMPLNVAYNDGVSIDIDASIYAIKYAVDNGADIVNLSFGGLMDLDYFSEAIQYAYDNNVLVVAATGNEGIDLDSYDYGPVCVDLTINAIVGVASTSSSNKKSSFSNYGTTCTDLSAPGESIALAVPSAYGAYQLADGTSFSAPLVAGIAALIKSKHSDWNVEEIKSVLFSTALDIDNLNSTFEGQLGNGIPDAYAALMASRPNVEYTYNPGGDFSVVETGEVIEIEIPDSEPISEEKAPVKDESIEENVVKKDESLKPVPEVYFPDTFSHPYLTSINYLKENGIISGYPDGTYKPDSEINRAEFTKIVVGAFVEDISGANCFPDVKDEWFASFVCTAKVNKIIAGYPDGTFRPDKPINVVEALKIILESKGLEFFHKEGEQWYTPYVEYAKNSDLAFIFSSNGYDENITRGEMAALIYEVIK